MNIVNLPSRDENDGVSVSYMTIKEYEGTDDCQRIVLCHGRGRKPEIEDSYAVLFMAPPGAVDGFATVAEFRHNEIGLQMAQMVADAADKVLAYVHMLQPDDEEDWTPEQINELCNEARETFGGRAADQLRAKLTGRAS